MRIRRAGRTNRREMCISRPALIPRHFAGWRTSGPRCRERHPGDATQARIRQEYPYIAATYAQVGASYRYIAAIYPYGLLASRSMNPSRDHFEQDRAELHQGRKISARHRLETPRHDATLHARSGIQLRALIIWRVVSMFRRDFLGSAATCAESLCFWTYLASYYLSLAPFDSKIGPSLDRVAPVFLCFASSSG